MPRWTAEELEQKRAELAAVKQEIAERQKLIADMSRDLAETFYSDDARALAEQGEREVAALEAEQRNTIAMRDEMRAELAEHALEEERRRAWAEQKTTNRINRLLAVAALVITAAKVIYDLTRH